MKFFKSPEFIFTFSSEGKGKASRNFHSWARKYQLKDGQKSRFTLLNNWEATYFNFNQTQLISLMEDAKTLGVDLFLLDDGWFGNKYPRSDDTQGLGDWQETKTKLPDGIPKLIQEAKNRNIKFGIWIEPEMVNPQSELYEGFNDWIIKLPNREEHHLRNQLVLDLSNPAVQDFVFGVIDKLKTDNPEIAYFKWDCNRAMTNIYSLYLKEKQSHLYIEYVRGLYKVFEKIDQKYPDLPIMLCSSGAGRLDYQALKYFTEFWTSDNTNPEERLRIQWGFSHFFPNKAMAAHVTSWGNQPLKFRIDVALMCKLGFDIRVSEFTEPELQLAQQSIKLFKQYENTLLNSDLYRLVSPINNPHCALMYVNDAKDESILFAFDIRPRFAEFTYPVCLRGLDPDSKYFLKEINLIPGEYSILSLDQKNYSGDYLMKIGIPIFSSSHTQSHVILLTKVE